MTPDTCKTYNIYDADCNTSARGGGGGGNSECEITFVCCVIFKPRTIMADSNGRCSVPA
jgi:hypothetical protein